MRILIYLVAVMLAMPAAAQDWSPEEQEVIDFTEQCWKFWADEDIDGWAEECVPEAAIRFWWMAESVPSYGQPEWRKWSETFFPRNHEFFQLHRPIAIEIHGDTVLYYYWATWSVEDGNGDVQTGEQHRLDVLQRQDGELKWIGGAGAPAPGTAWAR